MCAIAIGRRQGGGGRGKRSSQFTSLNQIKALLGKEKVFLRHCTHTHMPWLARDRSHMSRFSARRIFAPATHHPPPPILPGSFQLHCNIVIKQTALSPRESLWAKVLLRLLLKRTRAIKKSGIAYLLSVVASTHLLC